MHLLPDDDQRSIRATAAEMLGGAFGAAHAHDLADGRLDAGGGSSADAAWAALADMGWFGLALPDEAGGAGLSAVEEAMVFAEAGRALAPGQVLATVLAAHLAHGAGDTDLRDALLAGHRRAGLLLDHGDRLVAVAPPTDGVLVALGGDLAVHDLSDVSLGEVVELVDPATPAVACVSVGQPRLTPDAAVRDAVATRAGLLVAAYLTGIARQMLDLGVAYAKEREAFGSPIGSFQAIKHRLATVAMDTEAADAQVAYASVSLAQDFAAAPQEADAAKVLATQAALDACGAGIQTHGALGVTWEFDGHLFLTRARVLEHLPAGPRVCLDRLVGR